MPVVRVAPEARLLIELLANQSAQAFIAETLVPDLSRVIGAPAASLAEVSRSLRCAKNSMRVVLGYYAVSRKGHDRHVLSRLVLEALDRTIGGSEFEDFLESKDSEALWESFVEACQAHRRKPLEQCNRPILEGIAGLAFDIYEEAGHGNILYWIRDEVSETRRLQSVFERLTDIRTLGPKTASHLLRDVVVLFDIEKRLDFSEWIYLQPINSTVRAVSRYIVPEAREAHLADWLLAGKISKYVRLAGCSGAHFNMGCAHISTAKTESVDEALQALLNQAVLNRR